MVKMHEALASLTKARVNRLIISKITSKAWEDSFRVCSKMAWPLLWIRVVQKPPIDSEGSHTRMRIIRRAAMVHPF